MLHGRFRIIAGGGLPGDPGGGVTIPGGGGGGGGDPPNPPIDPTTRGPDDPGGGGGPINDGGGADRCSLIHTVKFDRDSPDQGDSNFFNGVWFCTWDGGGWQAPAVGFYSVRITQGVDGKCYVTASVTGIGVVATFASAVATKCPGQSLYPYQDGFSWEAVRCFVG